MEIESFEFITKTENKARLFFKNSVGKKAMFFEPNVETIKYIELEENAIDVNDVVMHFMILRGDGLISLKSLIKSGFG